MDSDIFLLGSSSINATSTTSPTSEASASHASASTSDSIVKKLLNNCHGTSATTHTATSSHTTHVLSLWLHCELSTLEQRLIQMLRLDRAFFVYKLYVCKPNNKFAKN